MQTPKMHETSRILRPYQLDAISRMQYRDRNLEFDDMGLGKTVTTLMSIALKLDYNENVLIVCPKNALYVWKDEIEKWLGLESIVYSGTPKQREKLWYEWEHSQMQFFITTYGMLKELPMCCWTGLIADEIHAAGLLNHKTATFKLFKKFSHETRLLYLLTGTPIRQGVVDLYAPLNLVDAGRFSNYWGFINRYCIVNQTPYGKTIERNPRDIATFRELLNQYMIRRVKTEVLSDLPGKQRQTIGLDMTPKQVKAHKQIIEELLYVDEDAVVITPNKMTAILRLRQLLVCPRLLDIDDDGAALTYLKEVGGELLENKQPIVVFTPFKQAIPYITQVLESTGTSPHVYVLSGGLTADGFREQWQSFQEDTCSRKVLICVIKSGAAFHATSAAHAFFLGYEWDFNLNAQAEDRLCRMGQKQFVTCYYLLHNDDSVDNLVKKRLNDKQDASNWVIGTQAQYEALLARVQNKKKK